MSIGLNINNEILDKRLLILQKRLKEIEGAHLKEINEKQLANVSWVVQKLIVNISNNSVIGQYDYGSQLEELERLFESAIQRLAEIEEKIKIKGCMASDAPKVVEKLNRLLDDELEWLYNQHGTPAIISDEITDMLTDIEELRNDWKQNLLYQDIRSKSSIQAAVGSTLDVIYNLLLHHQEIATSLSKLR